MRSIPNHIIVASSAWISKVVTAGSQLLVIPILINSIGLEKYAAFALLQGLIGWFSLSNGGLGNSLQNYISELRACKRDYRDYISVTCSLLLILLLILIALFFVLSPLLGPVYLSEFDTITTSEKYSSFLLVALLSIVAGVSSIGYNIWFACQKGYLSNIVPAVASMIALSCVYFIIKSDVENKFFWIIFSYTFPFAIFSFSALWYQLIKLRTFLKWDKIIAKNLMTRAWNFWSFSIMSAFVLQVDYIIISQYLSAHDIAVYVIATKIFSLLFFVYSALLSALWPVCAEELTKNNWDLVVGYIRRYIFYGGVLIIVGTIIVSVSMPIIVGLLSSSKNLVIPVSFVLTLGVYYIVRVWTDTFAMVLQSINYFRPIWIYVPIQAFLSIILQIILVKNFGIYGVVFGLISSFILTVFWALPKSVFKQAHHKKVSL